MWQAVLNALYPPRCVACGQFCREPLCPLCTLDFAPIRPPACARCGAPLRDFGECRACLGREFAFDAAVCGALYDGSVRRAVLNLKFRRWRRAAEPLANLVWQALQFPERAALPKADALVPVPIHSARRAMRGFNQAELVAQRLSGLSGVPVRTDWLRRRFYRRPQVGLSSAQRLQNVQNAFEVVCPDAVRGRVVWLLDDVFTTGGTLNACADALRQAGAALIVALAVARDLCETQSGL
ncbi:MAG: ComF family protein [Fimbriimonadales bacterium]|nr:ComF family protein [Fimbriimonadales bacterium]